MTQYNHTFLATLPKDPNWQSQWDHDDPEHLTGWKCSKDRFFCWKLLRVGSHGLQREQDAPHPTLLCLLHEVGQVKVGTYRTPCKWWQPTEETETPSSCMDPCRLVTGLPPVFTASFNGTLPGGLPCTDPNLLEKQVW